MGGLEEKLGNPEFQELIKKSLEYLGIGINSRKDFFEALAMALSYLQINQGAEAGLGNAQKHKPKERRRNVRVTQRSDFRFDHSTYQVPQGHLEIPADQLESTNAKTLIERVMLNYHKHRPKLTTIRSIQVDESASYTFDVAAKALGTTKEVLGVMKSPSQHLLTVEDRKVPGYEIIRLHLRPSGSDKGLSYVDVAKIFYISTTIVERLLVLGVFDLLKSGNGLIRASKTAKLYDLVFPRKNTQEYKDLMALLSKEQNAPPIPDTSARVGAPFSALQPPIPSPAVTVEYVPFRIIREANLTRDIDYQLVKDSDTQNPDAYNIRHRVGNTNARGQTSIELNSIDVARLRLARYYIRWSEVVKPEENANRLSMAYGGRVVQGKVLEDLASVGIPAIFYRQEWCLAPGSVDILSLSKEEREKIAIKAVPLIAKYGPFISFRQVNQIAGGQITFQNFIELQKKIGLNIKNITVGNDTRYNLFQIVQAYYGRIK